MSIIVRPPTKVRTATEADVDALVRLNEAVQAPHAALYPSDFKPTPIASEVHAFFIERLKKKTNVFALAFHQARAVGYIWFDVDTRPETPFTFARRRLYIHHSSVDPDVRRQGVASALLHHASAYATADGIEEIAMDSWTANTGAQDFFASQGFAPFNLRLRKLRAVSPLGARNPSEPAF